MNDFFQIGDKTWFCFSVFYSKNDWRVLLDEIFSFSRDNKSIIDCLTFFSEDKGEHISVAYSSQTIDPMGLQTDIEKYFTEFLNRKPSSYANPFKLGKAFWSFYPVNTIVWNRFGLKRSISGTVNDHIIFCNLTTLLISHIAEADFSEENLWPTALYLTVRLCKFIPAENLIPIINMTVENISVQNGILQLGEHDNIFHNPENMHVVDLYWHDEDSEDMICKQWTKETYDSLHKSNYQAYPLLKLIYLHIGISDIESLLLLDLLKKWLDSTPQ